MYVCMLSQPTNSAKKLPQCISVASNVSIPTETLATTTTSSVPSSLVLEGLVLSSLTCTCKDPPLACSPGERHENPEWTTWMRRHGRHGQIRIMKHHLRLHLASFCNINIDYVHLLPGFCIQTVYLKQNHRAQLDTGTNLWSRHSHTWWENTCQFRKVYVSNTILRSFFFCRFACS